MYRMTVVGGVGDPILGMDEQSDHDAAAGHHRDLLRVTHDSCHVCVVHVGLCHLLCILEF